MHVIDYAIHRSKRFQSHEINNIRHSLPRARRFIFDQEAARITGCFIRECPDIILNNRQFAIPPYESTYIEIPFLNLISDVGANREKAAQIAESHGFNPKAAREASVGYMCVGNKIYVVSSGLEDSKNDAFIVPFFYELNTTKPQPESFAFPHIRSIERQEWAKLSLMLGSTIDHLTEDHRQDILNRNIVDILFPLTNSMDFVEVLLNGAMGDVRNIWAALLLLNQPGKTVFEHFPAGRRIVRGKLRAYSAYNIVSINIGRRRSTRRAFHFEDRSSPRRHEVRGHFAHFHTDKHCEHKWPIIPDDDQRWYCERCGGFRIWRKDHLRGDAAKGYVNKVYEIHE